MCKGLFFDAFGRFAVVVCALGVFGCRFTPMGNQSKQIGQQPGTSDSSGDKKTIISGSAASIAVNAMSPFETGNCAGPFTISVMDENGNLAESTNAPEMFSLDGLPPNSVFNDSYCTEMAPDNGVMSGGAGNKAVFYVNSPISFSKMVSVTARGLNSKFAVQVLVGRPAQFQLATNASVSEDQCTLATIALVDKNQNNTVTSQKMSVGIQFQGLSQAAAYSDAHCSNPVTSIEFSVGSGEKQFYWSSEESGQGSVKLNSSSVMETLTASVEVLAPESPQLVLVTPPGQIEAGTCAHFRVNALSPDKNPLPAKEPLNVIVISQTNQLLLFSDDKCQSLLTLLGSAKVVTMAVDSSSVSFYGQSTLAHTGHLEVTATGFISSNSSVKVVPSTAQLISVESLPDTIPLNSCTTFLVRTRDVYGNVSAVTSSTQFTAGVSGAGSEGIQMFSGGLCTTSPLLNFTLPNGSSVTAVSVFPKSSGALSLTLTSSALKEPGQGSTTVTSPPPQSIRLSLTSQSSAIVAGQCGKMSVATLDSSGAPISVSESVTVFLRNDQGSGDLFFLDSNCSSSSKSIQIANGKNGGDFFVRDTAANVYLVTVSATDTSNFTTTASKGIAIIAAAPSVLKLSKFPESSTAKAWIGPILVDTYDAFGNLAIVNSNTILSLETTGANTVQFAVSTSVSGTVDSVTLKSGRSRVGFFFRSNVVGNVGITVSASGFTPASIEGTLSEPAPLHLVTQMPSSTIVGQCLAFQVLSLDPEDSPKVLDTNTVVIGVSGVTGNVLFSDSTCQTALANDQVTLDSNSNPATFHFRYTTAKTITINLTASATSQNSGATFDLLPAAPNQLSISSAGKGTFPTHVCQTGFSVEVLDKFGNPSIVTSNLSLTVTPAGVIQAKAYLDSSCSQNGVLIPNGKTFGYFSLKSTEPGNLNLKLSQGALIASSREFVILGESLLKVKAVDLPQSDPITNLDLGTVAIGKTGTQTVTLHNTSLINAIADIKIVIEGADFLHQASTRSDACNPLSKFTLAPQASCSFNVSFSPQAKGTHEGVLNFESLVDTTSVKGPEVKLVGVGEEIIVDPPDPKANLVVSTTDIGFGEILKGATSQRSFTLKNTGTATATDVATSGLSTPLSVSLAKGGSACTSIAAGESCDGVVTAKPVANGAVSQLLKFSYAEGSSTSGVPTISVSVTGKLPAELELSPSAITFPTTFVNQMSGPQNITVTNIGTMDATEITYSSSSSNFQLDLGNCSRTLKPETSCTLSVQFSPPVEGSFSSQIVTNYTASGSQEKSSATVSGDSNTPSKLSISPDGVEFEATPLNKPATAIPVLITNVGGVEAKNVSLSIKAPFVISPLSCGTLSKDQSCFAKIGFTPTSTTPVTESLIATCTSTSPGVTCSGASASVSGSTLPQAALLVSPSSLDFGTLNVGQSAALDVSLTADGSAGALPVTLISVALEKSAAGLSLSNGCSNEIESGTTCLAKVSFNPSAASNSDDSLIVKYSQGAGGRSLTIPISAVAISPLKVTLSPSSITFAETILNKTSAPSKLTVTNSGQVSASQIQITGPWGDVFKKASSTCPAEPFTLSPSSSCTVSITFTPTSIGTVSQSFGGSYSDGHATFSAGSFTLSGDGIGQAVLAPSLTSIMFTPTEVGKSQSRSVVIQNNGSGPATQVSLSVSGSQFSAPSNCSTITAGSKCSVSVTFSPTASGAFSGSLSVGYFDGSTSQNMNPVSLSGSTAAELTVSPSSWYFGDIYVGDTPGTGVTISNTGAQSLKFLSVVMETYSDATLSVTNVTCGDLPSGKSCTINLSARPMKPAVSIVGAVTIQFIDNNSSVVSKRIEISGSYKGIGNLIASPGSINFGDVPVGTTSLVTELLLTNNGNGVVSGLKQESVGPDFKLMGGTCSTVIQVGDSCVIRFAFAPTQLTTVWKDVLISYSSGRDTITLNATKLSGQGVKPGELTFSHGSLSFGDQGVGTSSASLYFDLTNSGKTAVTNVIVHLPTDPFRLSGTTCSIAAPFALSPGQSCRLNYIFTPIAAGAAASAVTVGFFDGMGASKSGSVSLSGKGIGKGLLTLNQSTIKFPHTEVGYPSTGSLVMTNKGTGPLSLITITPSLAAQFSITSNGCMSVLAVSESCTVAFRFYSGTQGSFSGNYVVDYHDGLSKVSAGTIILAGATNGKLSASPTSLDFGTIQMGTVVNLPVTVANIGGAAISSITASITPGTSNAFSVYTNGCTNLTIGPGNVCGMTLRYAPVIAESGATATATISAVNSDGTNIASVTVPLKGISKGLAKIVVSPTAMGFGEVVVGGTSLAMTMVFTNSGTATATQVTMGALPANFAVNYGTCGANGFSVVANGQCSVSFQFKPTAATIYTQDVSVSYFDGTQTVSWIASNVFGRGVGPGVLAFSPNVQDFGTAALNSTETRIMAITNSGTKAISSLAFKNPPLAPFSSEALTLCPVLNPGATCSLAIKFTPTTPGGFTSNVVISYFDGVTTQQSPIFFMQGNTSPQISVVPTSINFGTVTEGKTSAVFPVTITNTGGVNLKLASISFDGTSTPRNGFSLNSSTCIGPMVTQTSCTLNIIFTPPGVNASYASIWKLQMADSTTGAAGPSATVSLYGIGASANPIVASPNPLTLTSTALNSAVGAYIYFTNSGNTTVTISQNPMLNMPMNIPANYCHAGYTIAPGGNCRVYATFIPVTYGGPWPQMLYLMYTANGNQSMAYASLTGVLTAMPPMPSPLPMPMISPTLANLTTCGIPGGSATATVSANLTQATQMVCSGTVLASGSMNNSDAPLTAQNYCNNARTSLIAAGQSPTCCMFQIASDGTWALTNGSPVVGMYYPQYYTGTFSTNHAYVFASSCAVQ